MGTKADFYLMGKTGLQWIGSCLFDGYPAGVPEVIAATTEEAYVEAVRKRITEYAGVHPSEGWPWRWEDSSRTCWAYMFGNGKVLASDLGSKWFNAKRCPKKTQPGVLACFPKYGGCCKTKADAQREVDVCRIGHPDTADCLRDLNREPGAFGAELRGLLRKAWERGCSFGRGDT